MDSDALIKLTKASFKEDVAQRVEILLPKAVEAECTEAGASGPRPDALLIQENVKDGRLRVLGVSAKGADLSALRLAGGEAEVLALMEETGADLVVSDDRRFLRLLRELGTPFTTPAGLVVALALTGKIDRTVVLSKLDALGLHVSDAEIVEAKRALMEEHP